MTDDQRWQLAECRGWGPDYTWIEMQCSESPCLWEYTWEDTVNLGAIVRTLKQHLADAHGIR